MLEDFIITHPIDDTQIDLVVSIQDGAKVLAWLEEHFEEHICEWGEVDETVILEETGAVHYFTYEDKREIERRRVWFDFSKAVHAYAENF